MSGAQIVAELKRLNGVSEVHETFARQFLFQASKKTFYCCVPMQSIMMNNFYTNYYGIQKNEATEEILAANEAGLVALRDYYFWGNENKMELQNHSEANVFVKIHYCEPRDPITVDAVLTEAANPRSPTDVNAQSFPLKIWHEGIKTLVDSATHNNTGLPDQLNVANDQYLYGRNQVQDGISFDYGEGTGVVPGTNAGVYFGQAVGTSAEWGVSTQLGATLYDSPLFTQMFKVYNTKKFVLGPECSAHFSLSDKRLKVLELESSAEIAAIDQHDKWDPSSYHTNMFSKFVIIEVVGSLTGASIYDAGGTDNVGYTGTAADDITKDTLNMAQVLNECGTHGGVMRLMSEQKGSVGYYDLSVPGEMKDFMTVPIQPLTMAPAGVFGHGTETTPHT